MATGGVVVALLAAAATPASAREPFRNVLPAGQGETVDATELGAYQASGQPPATFLSQNGLYTGLVGAAPALKPKDLDRYFKPERFGVPADQVASEVSPRAGVRIVRDKAYNVPHVSGDTRADTMFGAGYATAQDRLFFMDVLRHTGRARLTELIGPGEDDANVKADAEQLKIADYDEGELQAMIDRAREAAGPEGATIQADLDAYVAGVNQYIREARTDPSKLPAEYPALGKMPADWKATDTVAIASLIGGIFGKGGGGEAKAAQALAAAQQRFGAAAGRKVFGDFRSFDEPEAPVTTTKRFRFDDPGRANAAAVAMPDLGSIQDRDPVVTGGSPLPSTVPPIPGLPDLPIGGLPFQRVQSNALLVGAKESKSGHPLGRHGPAGRLLLARDPDGDRPPRRRHRRARRHVPRHQPVRADRARQGLRLEHHDRVLRQRRRVRREALRPGGGAPTALRPLPLQGAVRPVRDARPARSRSRPRRPTRPARRRARSGCASCAACTARSRRPPRSAARPSRSRRRARPTGTRSTRSSPTSGSTPAR